ncbi:hypothetical protein ZWY2020_029248 [Hordeum vulgare]|nr:hypothetical protein ZWY2020_029248 [Hordeum vulgare]
MVGSSTVRKVPRFTAAGGGRAKVVVTEEWWWRRRDAPRSRRVASTRLVVAKMGKEPARWRCSREMEREAATGLLGKRWGSSDCEEEAATRLAPTTGGKQGGGGGVDREHEGGSVDGELRRYGRTV